MCYVYILQNPKGKLYIGITENLATRLADHNRTDCICGKYTRKNGPWELVWSEEHPNRSSAIRRERQIKSWKSSRYIRETLLEAVESRFHREAANFISSE